MPTSEGSSRIKLRWLLAAVRRRQLLRLVEHRRESGAAIDARSLMIVGCDCLAGLKGRPVPPHGSPHLGLVPSNAQQLAKDMRLVVDNALIDDAIEGAARRGGRLWPDEAGRHLGLTRVERDAVRAWSMDAIDESRDARRERKAAERRIRDRERLKSKRAERRAAQGKPPHGSPALKVEGPWRALGISERTWYRRQKALASVCGRNPSQTYVQHQDGSTASPPLIDTDERRVTAMVLSSDGGASSPRPPNGDTHAERERVVMRLLGEGSVQEGRRIALMIDTDVLDRLAQAVRNDTIVGDTRLELVIAAADARVALSKAERVAS